MARKSIELERSGLRTPRERLWAAMRALTAERGAFTAYEVIDRAHLPGAPVLEGSFHDYLRGLLRAGYAEACAPATPDSTRFVAGSWRLTRDQGAAPSLNRDGTPTEPAIGITAMWRAMKIRKVFDAAQIALDASAHGHECRPTAAASYVQALAYAGYLRVEQPARRGMGRRKAVYRLVRDTGPLPPAVTRAKVVFDRNIGALVPVETAQQVCDALARAGGL